jgi:hypothetical protein
MAAAVALIPTGVWTPAYDADGKVRDGAWVAELTDGWTSRAEVTEIPFTTRASQKKTHQIPGRLVVRRIPDLRPTTEQGHGALFDVWRFHAFFTTTDPADLGIVAADKTHRHGPAHDCLGSRAGRLLSPAIDAAPADTLAMGNVMDNAVRQRMRPQSADDHLTLVARAHLDAKDPVEPPDAGGRTINHADTLFYAAQGNSPKQPPANRCIQA